MNFNTQYYKEAILANKIIQEKVSSAIRSDKAHRRWFWELLQNAKDTVVYNLNKGFDEYFNNPNRKAKIRLTYGQDLLKGSFLKFEHSGNPFRYTQNPFKFDDVTNLILPVSGKDKKDENTTGKFGTGFLSTHTLSLSVKVEGVYQKEDKTFHDFSFELDRTKDDEEEQIESIVKTLTQKDQNFKPKFGYQPNIENFSTTKFTYWLRHNKYSEEKGKNIVEEGLKDLNILLPFSMIFIKELSDVTIVNQFKNESITFSKHNVQSIPSIIGQKKYHQIRKETKVNNSFIPKQEYIDLIEFSNDKVDIALQAFQNSKGEKAIYPTQFVYKVITNNEMPVIFSSLPLIGSEDFKFPAIINSSYFKPRETRDGIHLKNDFDGNQSLIQHAVNLYSELIDYCSTNNLRGLYNIAHASNGLQSNHDWISQNWYEKGENGLEGVQNKLREKILKTNIVDTFNPATNIENKKAIKNEQNAHNLGFPIKENKERLWYFGSSLFPGHLPKVEEIESWNSIIWNQEDFIRINPKYLIKIISAKKSIQELSTSLYGNSENDNIQKTLEWHFDFIKFLIREVDDISLLNLFEDNSYHPILPNRNLKFKLYSDLALDVGFEGKGIIEDELLEIAEILAIKDFRDELLHNKFSELLELKKEPVTEEKIGETISILVREKLKDDLIPKEIKTCFSKLYNWIRGNEPKAKKIFKDVRIEKLLYTLVPENKATFLTKILEMDRDNKVSLERQCELLSDPLLELKIKLGEQALEEQEKEKREFEFKAQAGKVFEDIFHKIISQYPHLNIEKVDGEQDYIITNKNSLSQYYIELKSIGKETGIVQMPPKQAKKAVKENRNYVLCIIKSNGVPIDENVFKQTAQFDDEIGLKLSKKVSLIQDFENFENGISIHFEDSILSGYKKYRYKFEIHRNVWNNVSFNEFIEKIK